MKEKLPISQACGATSTGLGTQKWRTKPTAIETTKCTIFAPCKGNVVIKESFLGDEKQIGEYIFDGFLKWSKKKWFLRGKRMRLNSG